MAVSPRLRKDRELDAGESTFYRKCMFNDTPGAVSRPRRIAAISRRIELARDLLALTDRAITDFASACGFSDQSHFTRVFSQSVGAPRMYGCQ